MAESEFTDILWQLAIDDDRAAWPGCHIATFVDEATRHVVIGISQCRLGLTPASAAGWGVPYFPSSYIGLRVKVPTSLRPDNVCPLTPPRSDCGLLADNSCFESPVNITASKCSWYLAARLRKTKLEARSLPDALLRFLEHAMMTWCSACFVCGEALGVTASQRIKPSTCDSAVCRSKHEHLGIGCDLLSDLQADPKMASLLLQIAVASAVVANRAPLGFPEFMLKGTAIAATKLVAAVEATAGPVAGAGRKHPVIKTDKVVALLSSIPAVQIILNSVHNDKDLVEFLTHEQYSALRWVLASNKCHVHSLDMFPPHCRLALPETTSQFVVQTCVNEAAFDDARRREGSFFAWHGSSLCNWHAILRSGLRCMSHTRYMSAGAALGAGVYFANNSGLSWKYASSGGGMGCIALCEIARCARMHTSGEGTTKVYVVQDEHCIAVRFLCFASVTFNVDASSLQAAAKAALREIEALATLADE